MNPKPKGILFKSEMIVALLNTQCDVWPAKAVDESKPWKWQTRRELKNQPGNKFVHVDHDDRQGWHLWWDVGDCGSPDVTQESVPLVCPHPPGSILYAKETFGFGREYDHLSPNEIYQLGRQVENRFNKGFVHGNSIVLSYKEDVPNPDYVSKWRPSIFMPPQSSRLWFRVMNVRVERVNEITGDDARAEGTFGHDNQVDANAIGRYRELWDSINGIGDFDKGKYVWVYEIQRITKPV